jgi:hypothetical protein
VFDTLSIGPVPSSEACESLGDNYNAIKARQECLAFIRQIRRQFGREPYGASLVITRNSHDFGTYLEVGVKYKEGNEAATKYAFKVEGEMPEEWDEEAKMDLEPVKPFYFRGDFGR